MKQLDNFLVENENIRSGLTRVIYPSRSGKILKDLKENLIGKMKPLALSSSGKNDDDRWGLITDAEGMNVAKLNGAEKLNYNNGSGLVSWMPTGAQLKRLTGKLKELPLMNSLLPSVDPLSTMITSPMHSLSLFNESKNAFRNLSPL